MEKKIEGVRAYTARLRNGQNIITVMAITPAEAQSVVNRELLRNASTRAYRDKWLEDGKIIYNAEDAH